MLNSRFLKPVIFSSILLLFISVCVSSKRYSWNPTEAWTQCSSQCGDGEETNVLECVQKTPYFTYESVTADKCSGNKMPINKRKCSLGPCPTSSNGSFVWRTGNWTLCPRTCGGVTLQNREVSCFQQMFSGKLLPAKLSKCDSKLEPYRFITCAKTDCPPKFLASKWGKCPKSKNCGKSVRRRNVQCVSILKDGKPKVISASFCYRLHLKPLSSWSVCIADNDNHCKKLADSRRISAMVAKIEKDEAEVYQMRAVKRLKLTVGQNASIFTFTKLSIECPIDGFPHNHLKWSHRDKYYQYDGESTSRIRVNRRGVLVIQEFLLSDVGVWRCHAGKSTADIVLRHELPSKGFQNWLRRHSNHNFGMFNEESKTSFIMPDSLMWMKSDWSRCSLSCGGGDDEVGYETRKVTCEMVEAKYFKVIDDKYCPSPMPITKRRCKSTISCPQWRVEKETTEKCTNHCIDIGTATLNTHIYCEYESRTVDSSFCNSSPQPNITCTNSLCKINYRYGPWSQCSLSCSNSSRTGIRSRTMQCQWEHNNQSASNLCRQYNVPNKPLVRSCRVPRCVLGCRDLTPVCQQQSKYRCRSSLFYHFCCAFCRLQNFY